MQCTHLLGRCQLHFTLLHAPSFLPEDDRLYELKQGRWQVACENGQHIGGAKMARATTPWLQNFLPSCHLRFLPRWAQAQPKQRLTAAAWQGNLRMVESLLAFHSGSSISSASVARALCFCTCTTHSFLWVFAYQSYLFILLPLPRVVHFG